MTLVHCCAECGEEGGASLKVCKSCMLVKYCNASCQHKHWPKHKIECKQRAAERRDEALFKDPPAKEDCPICFLPMPISLICCISFPPATISSVPIDEFAVANEGLAKKVLEVYYPCCGKSVCLGCIHSFRESGNDDKCAFCNSDRAEKTDEEDGEEIMKRVEANDPGSIFMLANYYEHGNGGLQQDHLKAIELYVKAANLGYSKAHYCLGGLYREGGNMKKAKFHYEAAAMAGHEIARSKLGFIEKDYGNIEQAVKHWTIAASAGEYLAMHELRASFENGYESMDSTLTAYNNACAEMRSEARDTISAITVMETS
jgi:tetratricopeptide (TPR) repeat protein